MKLTRFKIQNYKVIDDTEWVKLDEQVTALVGKNESGKTGILRALWKSNNVAGAKFDKLYDYPRDRFAKERKGTQEVVSLELTLTDSEADELVSKLPSRPAQLPSVVTCTTKYDGEENVTTELHFGEAVEKICLRPAKDARDAIQAVADALTREGGSLDAAVESARGQSASALERIAHLWDKSALNAISQFHAAVKQWVDQDSPNRASVAKSERENLDNILTLARQGDPLSAAQSWFLENMPTFIYYSDYGQLKTRIHLPTYLSRSKSPDEEVRTQSALFDWSYLDAQEILSLGQSRTGNESDDAVFRRKEKRRALLDSASFGLTGDWVKWWDDREHKLHFDADGEDLVLKVADPSNPFPLPFEERSHGFQWFFSFYLVFLVESRKAHKGAILLLDEPGLHLHPTLQAKLISLFDRIAADGNPVIYSTHLPFLLDGNHLERVRTIHRTGPEPQKTVVSDDVRPSGDRDTLFPLQAAVGYSIAQTLFLGKRSVIIEGITDYWLIKALSHCLATLEQPSLHQDTVLIPAGGTSRLMPLASIMFGTAGVDGRQLLVLLDSDKEGLQAKTRTEELFGDDARILLLGPVLGTGHATIEDLLPRSDYVSAVAAATGNVITLQNDESKEPTNVGALKRAFARLNLGEFGVEQKAKTALHLVESWGKDPKSVPIATREHAKKLFDAINAKFVT